MNCTPAQTVYTNHMDCLPYTGTDTLLIFKAGLILLVIGMAVVAMDLWLKRCDRRDAEWAARERFYGSLR